MPARDPTITADLLSLVLDEGRLQRVSAWLSEAERLRSARFATDQLAAAYSAARGQLREILGRALEVAPQQIAFVVQAYGKPAVTGLEFNLSHSGQIGVCVSSRDCTLGVDVEHLAARRDWAALSDLVFCLDERAELERCLDRDLAFYRLWTCKEAVMKADGRGFALDPQSFRVPAPAWAQHCDETDRGSPVEADGRLWRVQGIPNCPPGYVASVAHDGAGPATLHVAPWPTPQAEPSTSQGRSSV